MYCLVFVLFLILQIKNLPLPNVNMGPDGKVSGKNVVKFGLGDSINTCIYISLFDLIVFKAIWGYSVHLSQNSLQLERAWS